jgi:hypothetical protein
MGSWRLEHTFAPCSASAIALAAPMPVNFEAPVTIATWPARY